VNAAVPKLINRESESVPFMVSRAPAKFGAPRQRNLGKGIAAGLAGGLLGTIAMTQFQNAWSKASQAIKSKEQNRNGDNKTQQQQGNQEQQGKEDATMKAAGKVVEFAGGKLSHEQKKKFGPVVHYSFGTIQGGIYGASLELLRLRGRLISGLAFGAAIFGLADELAVPALGLSSKPTEAPVSSHLYGLASHLVYGITAEVSRRAIRALL
jgi:hypothetical protein